MSQLTPVTTAIKPPAMVAASGDRAQTRFWEFFAAQIRNTHAALTQISKKPTIAGSRAVIRA